MSQSEKISTASTSRRTTDPPWVRRTLIGVALSFVVAFVGLPIFVVFHEAFSEGAHTYVVALSDPATLSSIRLTITTALVAVPLNVVFGLAAAWAISRFEFRGKSILVSLIDVPFAVSPVVAGMLLLLLFGGHGILGPFLRAHGIRIVFAEPGIILATTFVTLPFVARELIPLLSSQGVEEEQAALVLGASGWRTFFSITLPKAKWGLLYGIVLSTARAVGEFGAVSVVSGHIRGETNTIPLTVEVLYGEYKSAQAFAVASILLLTAFATLAAKRAIASYAQKDVATEPSPGRNLASEKRGSM